MKEFLQEKEDGFQQNTRRNKKGTVDFQRYEEEDRNGNIHETCSYSGENTILGSSAGEWPWESWERQKEARGDQGTGVGGTTCWVT